MKRVVYLVALSASLVGVAQAKPVTTPSEVEDTKAPVVVASTETESTVADETVVSASANDNAKTTPEAAPGLVPELTSGSMSVKIFGSIRPTAGIGYRSTAIERDRLSYGVTGSRLDLGANAKVGGGVSAQLYVGLGANQDSAGNTVGEIALERALVVYEPIDVLRFSIGRDWVPLSAQSATPTYARVFPHRIRLDDTFVLPADVGAQAAVVTNYATATIGVWNGIGRDTTNVPGISGQDDEPMTDERGLLYSARVEATPLGSFEFDERGRPDSLRIGVGAAATYRAVTEFTPTGNSGLRSRDLRASLSLRAAYRGLYVQAEALRRQITDDLSMRPDVATAGYVQGSYRFVTTKLDVAPLARIGVEKQRQLSAPGTGSSTELGVAVYPLARGTDRLQLTAIGQRYVDPIFGTQYEVTGVARLGF